MTVSRGLASWALSLKLDDVPAVVQHAGCQHLLDGLGTALAARLAGAGEPAINVAAGLGGPHEATILGTAIEVSAPAAALANGTLVHTFDYDDTHSGGLVHATASVLPAAFAVGEQVGADGSAVLRASVAGFEAVCRIAAASPHGFHSRGIHATHACGVLSAALIASLLSEASLAVTIDALGIAGSAASGLLEFLNTGAATKQLHPGTAGLNGIIAARLAAAGASGPSSVLEGDKGLFAALSARPADPHRIVEGLGSTWETAAIGIKPYPACQLLHATLDAVTAVLDDIAAPEQVARVVADVHPDSVGIVCEPGTVKLRPRTAYDAKFSLPWSVAALLVDRTVRLETYSAESIARPDVADLAKVVETRRTDDTGPAAAAGGHVVVHLTDGRALTGDVPGSRGSAGSPMPESEIVAKFLANCGGSATAGELAATMLALPTLSSLKPVIELSREVVKERVA